MRFILFAASIILLMVSCSRDKITDPVFDVSTSSLTYKAGDSVIFNFSGEADNIVFFSGEPGYMYDNKARTFADNQVKFSFTSLVVAAVIYKNLQVLASVNYNGLADTNSIKAATWTDISDRAAFSIGRDSLSGVVDITDIAKTNYDALVYIAFRYTDYKKPQGQNRWTIKAFEANRISPEGYVTPLATLADAAWKAVNFQNTAAIWTISATQLQMYGGTSTAANNEDWIITKGFSTGPVSPDMGIPVKNISMAMLPFGHKYMVPGTYKIVFEVSNSRYDGDRRLLKEMTLTVTP
jgi:hypothetical protein